MRRILQLGLLLLLLSTVLMPIAEYFDRWDSPGLNNDTELALFCLILVLCLILVVGKLLSEPSPSMDVILLPLLEWCPAKSLYCLRGFPTKLVLPPIAVQLRI